MSNLNPLSRKFTDEQLKQIISENPNISNHQIGRMLNVNEKTIRTRKKKLAQQGWAPECNWNNTIPEGYKIKGMSDLVDCNGNLINRWVKSEKDKEDKQELFLECLRSLIKEIPNYPLFTPKQQINYNETLCIYPLGDPHIGMYSWAEECGESWNLKIAEETFRKMFDIIVSKSPKSKKAILLILGDTLHFDNLFGITSKSKNILDTSGKYPEIVTVCINIILNMINSLLNYHEEIIIDIVEGNHDNIGAVWLRELIQRLYKDNPRTNIILQRTPIHIYEYGKVLITSHHGDTISMDKLPETIAADYAEAWGRTKHRYCLTGHIHKDKKIQTMGNEYSGIWVESFRTLAPRDSYATWNAWRAKRDTKCIVYHKEIGEIERYTASIDSLLLQI